MDVKRAYNPICPSCGRLMRLASVEPAESVCPELRTYNCRPCGVAVSEVGVPQKARWKS